MSDEVSIPGVTRVDGRSARALRTRSAIVDAHLELLRDGDLRPTGERIAERAGVSLRTLWTNFKDMETLFAAAGERLTELQLAAHRPISPDLPLERRIDAFCRQRATMLEILTPAARAAVTREPFSPAAAPQPGERDRPGPVRDRVPVRARGRREPSGWPRAAERAVGGQYVRVLVGVARAPWPRRGGGTWGDGADGHGSARLTPARPRPAPP